MLFVFILFSNFAFSQHIVSDSLKHKKENNQLSSNAQVYVTKGAIIYDYTKELVVVTTQKNHSKPTIYATEDALIYNLDKDIEVRIIKANQKIKNKTIAKSARKNKETLQNKIVAQHHRNKSVNNNATYKALKDNSFFTIGNVVKNNGIFNNTISKGKKYIQISNEYISINNFDKIQIRKFRNNFSIYVFYTSENHFTRPPPSFI